MNQSFKPGEILDLACGTGEYSISLAHLGYQVTGVDISEHMIAYAKEKAIKENVNVNFEIDDMLNLSSENRYEGIICIGNALVHLNSDEDVKKSTIQNASLTKTWWDLSHSSHQLRFNIRQKITRFIDR